MTRRHSIKDLVCVNCGISFQTSHKRRYCCVACRNASKSGHTRRHICQHCANEFEGRKRKYCSSGCEAKAKRKRENKTGRARRYPTPIIDGQRECLDCGEVKSLESFRECANAGSGYASTCEDCFRGYHAIRARKRTKEQRRAERERAVAKQGRTLFKQYNFPPTQKQIDILAKRNAIDAWRYWINQKAPDWWLEGYKKAKREMPNEAYRRRYQEDPEFRAYVLEKARVYKNANPEKVAEMERRWLDKRKLRVAKQHDGTANTESIRALFMELKRCPYCGKKLTATNKVLDHMDPVSLGGLHSLSNLVVCCRTCNGKKTNKPFMSWVKELPNLYAGRAKKLYERKRGALESQQSLSFFG